LRDEFFAPRLINYTHTHLVPPPGYRFRPPWYARPVVYVPAGILAVLLGGVAIYLLVLASDLRNRAATFDLNKLEQMESASVILDRNDKIFGQIYVENRETIPYDQLPRDLINAVVGVEDSKFYQHHGYDLFGIVRATFKNFLAGHVRQGASTITQQLARNSFALKEKTFRRKLLEIFLARRIEDRFGKQKIMELYLNRIYFGGGLYGAEAAARGYFGKSAHELSLAECATLAGLIKSPNRLSPWTDRAAARDARNYALTRMRDLGFIDNTKFSAAQAEEVVAGNRQNAQGQNYAVDYIRQQVIAAVGWDRAMNEGFRIHTTVDADLQKVAEDSLRKSLEKAEQHSGYDHQTYAEYAANFHKTKPSGAMSSQPAPEYLQGAVIGLDNQTGGILVLVGGRDFEHNQYDRALQARRPAGTAMLPFVYAAAFENGVLVANGVDGLDAIAVARAAGRLHHKAHRDGAGMFRELRGKMFRRALTYGYRQHGGVHRRVVARNLDQTFAGAAHQAREPRARRRCAASIEHVELVFARGVEALNPFAHDHEATCAGACAPAVMRDANAILEQAVKKNFSSFEVEPEAVHTVIRPPSKIPVQLRR